MAEMTEQEMYDHLQTILDKRQRKLDFLYMLQLCLAADSETVDQDKLVHEIALNVRDSYWTHMKIPLDYEWEPGDVPE